MAEGDDRRKGPGTPAGEPGLLGHLRRNRILWVLPLITLVVLIVLYLLAESTAFDNTNFKPF